MTDTLHAATVCEPCKRRKKACDKALPSCSRCSRLFMKCFYNSPTSASTLPIRFDPLEAASQAGPQDITYSLSPGFPGFPGLTEVADMSLRMLMDYLSQQSPGGAFYKEYFNDFQVNLPVIDENTFYWQLDNCLQDRHFNLLLAAMYLVVQQLSNTPGAIDRGRYIYPILKGAYSHFHASPAVTMELVQAGVLLASFEYCQALHYEAWLTVGACVRMCLVVREQLLGETKSKVGENHNFTTWWCMVVLERLIGQEFMESKLPCASDPPRPDDILPATSLDHRTGSRVGDDMLLPEEIARTGSHELRNRPFTTHSIFSTTIQATYLASLVTKHILDESQTVGERDAAAARLDHALQSYAGALIPPPGMAMGHFCGAYSIRTMTAFYLHQNELNLATESGRAEAADRARFALLSLTRVVIHAVKAKEVGPPLDLDSLAFWSHKMVHCAAISHIKYGVRDELWKPNLDIMKDYLKYLAPRYKFYNECLQDIEATEAAAYNINLES